MIIDLHVHEKIHSSDSRLSLEEIIQTGEERGLDGVCITDHESQDIRFHLPRYQKETRLQLFYGMEVLTPHGDLLVFGLDEVPDPMSMGTEAFITEVNRRHGALVTAHPFRKNERGFGNAIAHFSGLHGVEGYNGNTPFRYNQEAVRLAHRLSLPLVGGSDAHFAERLGIFVTAFPMDIRTEKQLAHALRLGQGTPLRLTDQGYQQIVETQERRKAV